MVALDRKVVILEWLLDPTAAVSECRKSAQWGHKTRQGSADSSLLKTNQWAWDRTHLGNSASSHLFKLSVRKYKF